MRVGILTYGLDRPPVGIARYTLELPLALTALERPPSVVLLTAGGVGPLAAARRWQQVPLPGCRLLPGLMTLGNLLLPRAARRAGVDVVHDPTGVTPFGLGAGGAKTVVTIHDVVPWAFPGVSSVLDTLIYRRWLPRVLPRVDAVIAISQSSKADVVRYLNVPADKIHVIPRTVPSAAYRPAAAAEIDRVRAHYGLPEGYILYVGTIEARKNVWRLLEAYADLRATMAAPPLVLVGPASTRHRGLARRLRARGLERHVIRLGYVDEADLPAVYSGADLFVFPTLYEGFGDPPLEAMACGTPVVTSQTSSVPEVVGDAAIMINPYDVSALTEAMRRVLQDGALRHELGRRGLQRAQLFTWERAARETRAVYERLLA